jgi:phospholipid N-methyltransferase
LAKINLGLVPVPDDRSAYPMGRPKGHPLAWLKLRVVRLADWDRGFIDWIERGRSEGRDPNDVGDEDWANDPLSYALARHYLKYVTPESVVMELGPGTGRLTRHVLPHCERMVLVDYSPFVCSWLQDYLRGKGAFQIHHITRPRLPAVANSSVDVVLSNGVFEHLDPEDTLWFLDDFARVLRPGGVVCLNFNNLMSAEGVPWLRRFSPTPGQRCVFRFYHPDAMAHLAEEAGLEVIDLDVSDSRFAFMEARRPL